MFPIKRHQKVTDPELKCPECDGFGWKKETQQLAFGTRETDKSCDACNTSGEDPSKKPLNVLLTPNEIIHIRRALGSVKDVLNDDEPGDKESREIFQRLFKKFSELT